MHRLSRMKTLLCKANDALRGMKTNVAITI